MKHIYKIILSVFVVTLLAPAALLAQQEVMIRDLHTYDSALSSQSDLEDHPLVGVEVTFDAVVVSYPKNSGLASITDAGVPGRIHVFVTDVNAVAEGEAGMTMQIVVEGTQRETLEALNRGDVIRVVGDLGFFGPNAQFDATDVTYLGSIQDTEYEDLAELLEPEVIQLTEVNEPANIAGQHQWVADNYSTYIHRYVKFEGLEVIDRIIDEDGRPWFILTDGTTILTSNDTSLRFRNDRGAGYAYDPETGEGLGYNWRRLDESLDGPFTPPPPGSIVDVSGYLVYNSFDPGNFDVSEVQSTLKIAPWDDGVVWTADGTDPANRMEPADWPNDLVVQGFAPITDNFTITPDSGVVDTDEVTVSIDVELPEEDYTLNSVEISYSAYPYTADSGDTTTVGMTANGNTYSFTFDSYDEFTKVDFTITATAETPEGVITRARQNGSFEVVSATQTSPVRFSPTSEVIYPNSVNVTLTSATEDATIYYTLDGTDPDVNSTEYSEELSFFETTNIKAIAIADGLEDSPISSRTYEVEDQSLPATTLAEIRDGETGAIYRFTGDAVVTHAHANRNQIFLMDASGGLLIDDPDNIITSDYAVGDVMSGLLGRVSGFGGLPQFVPLSNPGDPTETAAVEPVDLTLADLDPAQHKSMLVRVEDVIFTDRLTGTFVASKDYEITDPSLEDETMLFRTNFGGADYIGEEIPEESFTMTAIVGFYVENLQLTPRSAADMGMTVSNELEDLPNKFSLEQNYPNPFNPTTNIQYSVAEMADVNLVVYDILGRKVATLVNEVQGPGSYMVQFNASRFSSGAYFYRIEAGDFVSIRKMMLIK